MAMGGAVGGYRRGTLAPWHEAPGLVACDPDGPADALASFAQSSMHSSKEPASRGRHPRSGDGESSTVAAVPQHDGLWSMVDFQRVECHRRSEQARLEW